ncbi:MAG: hypothetical protein ACKOZY_12535, partial [Flavobacteriales bacterium]
MNYLVRHTWQVILVITALVVWPSVDFQAQTFTMTNGQTINACAGTFVDPGGPTGDYANSANVT